MPDNHQQDIYVADTFYCYAFSVILYMHSVWVSISVTYFGYALLHVCIYASGGSITLAQEHTQ